MIAPPGELARFRERCRALGLAVTHQRELIYSLLAASGLHPSPEAIYARLRRRIPTLSLGTVYRNIKVFIDAGLIREVSPLHERLRLDANLEPHHHLVCARCKKVEDLPEDGLEPVRFRGGLPNGFQPERTVVEVIGLCAACASPRDQRTRRESCPI
jgi:Fur family peroxide stress response transcriptional regulator